MHYGGTFGPFVPFGLFIWFQIASRYVLHSTISLILDPSITVESWKLSHKYAIFLVIAICPNVLHIVVNTRY